MHILRSVLRHDVDSSDNLGVDLAVWWRWTLETLQTDSTYFSMTIVLCETILGIVLYTEALTSLAVWVSDFVIMML